MGLTASQDALLNLPQSQPEHNPENAGNATNGEHGQPDGQVIQVWLSVKRTKCRRCSTATGNCP